MKIITGFNIDNKTRQIIKNGGFVDDDKEGNDCNFKNMCYSYCTNCKNNCEDYSPKNELNK